MDLQKEKPRSADLILAFAAALLVSGMVYLSLARLPSFRWCVLERSGFGAGSASLAGAAIACVGKADFGALLLVLAAGVVLVAVGWRERLASLWRALDARQLGWVPPLTVVALAALPYLARGNVMLADARNFQDLTQQLADVWSKGGNWYWSFYWYLGCAPYAFYGWLYWVVSGAVGLLIGLDLANKLLLFALHVGSAAAMFGCCRAATRDTRVAAVAALGYGIAFDHFARIFTGRTQLSLLYLFVPLLFWLWEEHQAGKLSLRVTVACGGILSAFLIFTHQVDGAFALVDFSVYALVRGIQDRRAGLVVRDLALLFTLGALLSSFWAVPMVLEFREASASAKAEAVVGIRLPTVDALWAFIPAPFKDRPLHYVGLCLAALGALGTLAEVRAGKLALPALVAWSFALSVLQSPRHMPIFLFGLAVAAGLGVRQLCTKGVLLPRVAVAALCLEALPMTAQLGYPDFGYLRDFYQTVHARHGERVLDLTSDRRTVWASVYLFSRNETLFGPLIECAPRGMPLWISITQHAAEEYYDRREPFTAPTLDALYLLGIAHVLVHEEQVGLDPSEVFRQKRGGLGLERDLRAQKLDRHSVMIAAPRRARIEPLQLMHREGWELKAAYERREVPFDEVKALMERMRLDRSSSRADVIEVVSGSDASLPGPVALEVNAVRTEPNRVVIDYEATPSFLALAYSYNDHLSVRIDGTEVPFDRTALDTIAVQTPGGKHRLEIEGNPSAVRHFAQFTSLLGVVSTLGLLAAGWRRRSNPV